MSNVKIYGKPDCVWCKRAVAFAEAFDYPYTYVDMTTEDGGKMFHDHFESMKIPTPKSVPQVFIEYSPFEDEYIGGCEDFEKWVRAEAQPKANESDIPDITL